MTPIELLDSHLLLNVNQVAEVLGCNTETVKNLHRVGQLPACQLGKMNMWRPTTIREFVGLLEENPRQ